MIVVVDFDGTVVERDSRPPKIRPGAADGLRSLRRAGHTLVLASARANRALRVDPRLDPLVRAGRRRADLAAWQRDLAFHVARYQEMCDFVARELPGVFDAIDDGEQGKPVADLYLDDLAVRAGAGPGGQSWRAIAHLYGEPPPAPGAAPPLPVRGLR